MKIKTGLLLLCLFTLAIQGKAQSKADKVLANVAARKAARESQLTQLRAKAAEQKGQLQFEKKGGRSNDLPPQAQNGNGSETNPNGRVVTTSSTPALNAPGRKE